MNTVIFNSENAAFKFDKKEVKERLICKRSEYDPDEITQLLELISTVIDETILSSVSHHYFGFVAIDLVFAGMGKVICKRCGKSYDAGQLREFTIGHGKSPFDIKQKQKGGIRLFEKRKMPSMFGGKGFTCPEGHTKSERGDVRVERAQNYPQFCRRSSIKLLYFKSAYVDLKNEFVSFSIIL